MSTLRETRDALLEMESPAKVLRLADKYLQAMQEMGSDFVLPLQHVFIKPILEFYAGDLVGWRKFVRGVRDLLPRRSAAQLDVQDFYRTIDLRMVQQERRERLNAAVDTAVRLKKIPADYQSKVRYAKRCTQHWLKRKVAVMAEARSRISSGRVSREECDSILTNFWAEIDDEISRGELPEL